VFLALVGIVAWVAGLTGALLGSQLSEWLDKPPSRGSDEPLQVAEPRDVIQTRVDVAGVVDFVAPTVVTISADVNGGTSLGTGVIISSDGEILTNAHVIENASEIRVRLAGESEPRRVSLLASDRGNDLALLRMSGDGYEAATFADPGSIRIGDEVVAIGFALGLDGAPSVTLGIVSALDRSIGQANVFLDGLIQTDAAISSGNSGGPLVNAAGEVVGINTAVARDTATASATNVSFAISVTEALPIVEALRAQASGATRQEAYFGVELADRRDGGQGVIVTAVEPETPAAAAGVLAGDLIVEVDGSTTNGSAGLIAAIRDRQAGDVVTIVIQRDGERMDLTVELTERPEN
jgi:S1-C subfamily serine protease